MLALPSSSSHSNSPVVGISNIRELKGEYCATPQRQEIPKNLINAWLKENQHSNSNNLPLGLNVVECSFLVVDYLPSNEQLTAIRAHGNPDLLGRWASHINILEISTFTPTEKELIKNFIQDQNHPIHVFTSEEITQLATLTHLTSIEIDFINDVREKKKELTQAQYDYEFYGNKLYESSLNLSELLSRAFAIFSNAVKRNSVGGHRALAIWVAGIRSPANQFPSREIFAESFDITEVEAQFPANYKISWTGDPTDDGEIEYETIPMNQSVRGFLRRYAVAVEHDPIEGTGRALISANSTDNSNNDLHFNYDRIRVENAQQGDLLCLSFHNTGVASKIEKIVPRKNGLPVLYVLEPYRDRRAHQTYNCSCLVRYDGNNGNPEGCGEGECFSILRPKTTSPTDIFTTHPYPFDLPARFN